MPEKKTQDRFIQELEDRFDNIDTSLIEYKNNLTEVDVRCSKHDVIVHEIPKRLLKMKNFCPLCREEEAHKPKTRNFNPSRERRKIKSKEDFVKEANKVHNGFYIYDKTDVRYRKCKNSIGFNFLKRVSPLKVTITCPIHGDFVQSAKGHLLGKGCVKCAIERSRNANKAFKTREDLIEAFKKSHGDEYDYSKVTEYKTRTTKVEIVCREHGSFWQSPAMHLRGEGCPKCDLKYKAGACERRLFHLVKCKFPDIEVISGYRDKSIFGRQHLDIYIPKYRIAIEYQGSQHFQDDKFLDDYRHSIEHRKELDERKFNLCRENNIDLLYFTFNKKFEGIDYFSRVFTDIDSLFKEIELKIEKISKKS